MRLPGVGAWYSKHRLSLLDLLGYALVVLGVSLWSTAAAVVLAGVVILLLSFTLRRLQQRSAAEATEKAELEKRTGVVRR